MEATNTNRRADSRLREEFVAINFPPQNWIVKSESDFDVVVIGAGMAGLAAAFALKRRGIERIQIYDKGVAGYEGPWLTYAKMPTLRSVKELVGPAQDIPGLTFRAWYESKVGRKGWEALGKIPTPLWMEYLRWFAQVLELPIQNERTLKAIYPGKNHLVLQIDEEHISTQKLVLATGREGFGGIVLPDFIHQIPKSCYSTAYEPIPFADLRNKRIGVIGGGASGFDAAATSLKEGVAEVEMILRRDKLPAINKGASNTYYGYVEGYFYLSDAERWQFQKEAVRKGIPPPVEALLRLQGEKRFKVLFNTCVERGSWDGEHVLLHTKGGLRKYDYLFLATGFATDGGKQPELAPFFDQILLWKDRPVAVGEAESARFLNSPYLGEHFQFLEKTERAAPFLKDIHCFNYAATMSHGQISGDIPGIGLGAERLARGIAIELFTENAGAYLKRLEKYQTAEFDAGDFEFLGS